MALDLGCDRGEGFGELFVSEAFVDVLDVGIVGENAIETVRRYGAGSDRSPP